MSNDPCDYLKAQEMQMEWDNPEWTKSATDDLLNMTTAYMATRVEYISRSLSLGTT